MPRKRRSPKRRIDALRPEIVDVLLTGDSEADPWAWLDLTDEAAEAAWRDFGPQLRAEAARRGISLPPVAQCDGKADS